MPDYSISASDLRQMYLKFFEARGHTIIPSASLIPDNDPTVLFTTAGMHPLVPYLLGETHPAGRRLVDVQKCVRTVDIDNVGDASHLTFFEMLGNWSLGDYFKREAIQYSWEFMTSPEYLNIPPDRLAFTVFEGEEGIPRDEESAALWMECGVKPEQIFYLGREDNWWGPAGLTGPCGPDTEMFIITDTPACGPDCNPSCSCGHYMEFWNDVFMQYNKTAEGAYEPLAQRNVDTGMGLDRTIRILQGTPSVYETDLLMPIIEHIERLSGKKYGADEAVTRAMRIVCDHIRTVTFIMGDPQGVAPSNEDKGYIVRRLIRRAVRYGEQLGMAKGSYGEISRTVIDRYGDIYPELRENSAFILGELEAEETRFARTLAEGLREFDKLLGKMENAPVKNTVISGKQAFRLFDTHGFPLEMTQELAAERGYTVDVEGFEKAFEKHRVASRGNAANAKGGMADSTEATTRLHSATHLLHAGLRKLVDPTIEQRGSNITADRLRFDFNFSRPLTPEEIQAVEDFVNEAIAANVPVTMQEMTVEQAREQGAIGLFASKYGDMVKVYTMDGYSREICGGPHAKSTGELGRFHIAKEQSSSAGVRRIRAVLE